MSGKNVPLVVALDVPGRDEAVALARDILPATPWMKVGLELFTAAGPVVIHDLKELGCKVFLDLKFHDIPNTVAGAVRSAIRTGADICNVHVSGGEEMCRAAARAAQEERAAGRKCVLLGVTVLTSAAADADTTAKVVEYALSARAWGLDGVVCSGMEAAAVKKAAGGKIICLCPGIRPASYSQSDDQNRVLTPRAAVEAGADYLVVGRPVTRASSPADAARDIVFSYS